MILREKLAKWADEPVEVTVMGHVVRRPRVARELLELLWPLIEAAERIRMRTHFDEAEGPELRAQNAANYRDVVTALAKLEERP